MEIFRSVSVHLILLFSYENQRDHMFNIRNVALYCGQLHRVFQLFKFFEKRRATVLHIWNVYISCDLLQSGFTIMTFLYKLACTRRSTV
jgi:hypothetical protein